jgi:protein involved in polysaccharide export with SLBB domain
MFLSLDDSRIRITKLRGSIRHRVNKLRLHCASVAAPSILSFVLLASFSGCSALDCLKGIPAVSVKRVPKSFFARPRSEMVQISLARLRQEDPKVKQLGPHDVLGIYIENVLGRNDEAPPVNFPKEGNDQPSIGFPIPIREDGTVQLPLVDPIEIAGLTLEQGTEVIRAAYTKKRKILPEGKDRIIVTLQKRRTERIMVVREEGNSSASSQQTMMTGVGSPGLVKRGTGTTVDLPAYENDLLHALNETGGLPGLDAENEILIIRGGFQDARQRELLMAQAAANRNPCDCPIQIPDDPNVTRIPIRYYPEQPPSFTTDDIILNTGDIVFVQSRDRELFYTGGSIAGGSHMIPRDYDIDILQAVALAGGSFGSGGAALARAGSGGGMGGSGGGTASMPIPPSRAIVIRKTCNGQTIALKVDLRKAITDSNQRILIQPNDMILVQFTCTEQIANFFLRAFQINYLLGAGGSRL